MGDLPLILLPPSEGKLPGGEGPPWRAGSMRIDLDVQRVEVADALRRAMRAGEPERRALLGVKGEALAAATRANRGILDSPTVPAIERYTGVLYGAVDFAGLDDHARAVLDDSVLILSGLWGLVAPADPIPDYKLKMGARLGPLGRLSTWWREPLSEAVHRAARGRRVWNLLPKEHDSALDLRGGQHGAVEQVSVTFLEPNKKGDLVAVSHWNKFLKGALMRHLLENPGTAPDDLAEWEHPSGFRLDPTRAKHGDNRVTLAFVRGI